MASATSKGVSLSWWSKKQKLAFAPKKIPFIVPWYDYSTAVDGHKKNKFGGEIIF